MSYYTPRPYGASSVGRLTVSGAYFVDASGHVVIRKSITAFCAPKRIMQGCRGDLVDFLVWVAGEGFNEIRIFSRVDWTGPPGSGVESGWQYDEGACEAVLVEAAALGLRVEVVAHTGKYGSVQHMADHLRAVDALCLSHDNALLEVYNEPQQNGGHALVADLLSVYTPQTPGWASGCYDPTPYPAGPAMTYHSPRKDEWSRCFKDAYEFSTGSGPTQPFQPPYLGPVMQDEPPQVEATIREHYWDPVDDWRAYGAGSAFFAAGATMHSNPTLQQCDVPTDPTVLSCIAAFIEGLNDVPAQVYSGYSGALTPPSSNPGSRRYQRNGADGGRYEICVRPFSFRRVG